MIHHQLQEAESQTLELLHSFLLCFSTDYPLNTHTYIHTHIKTFTYVYEVFEMLVNFYLLLFKETFNETDSIKSFIKKLQNQLFPYTDCFRIYILYVHMYCVCIETAHTYIFICKSHIQTLSALTVAPYCSLPLCAYICMYIHNSTHSSHCNAYKYNIYIFRFWWNLTYC